MRVSAARSSRAAYSSLSSSKISASSASWPISHRAVRSSQEEMSFSCLAILFWSCLSRCCTF